ncbi:MAG: TIGR03936 family radical SAM-associated protein [Candidatus Omnitrophica bacterium]|nr:TIGR03936 family radical SAM-associated protein [Candidatus Omnitrophota bacterium]MCM8833071.1 TIGR03936 family radical SAM-associated protein [Candidatus Omnitrophota bacterium]
MEPYRLRVFYKKDGISRFISHLSFCKLIERILRRLDLPLRFSQGFTPHLKISFCPPLPIPIVGENEFFEVEFYEKIDIEKFIERINLLLPEGTIVKKCYWTQNKFSLSSIYAIYTIPLKDNIVKEKSKEFGKIIEEKGNFIKVIFKMENFSHKRIFLNGIFDGIKRELFIEDEKI